MTIAKNPGRSLAFAVGAFVGSQAPHIPESYETYLESHKSFTETAIRAYEEKLESGFFVNLEKFLKLKKDEYYDKETIENLLAEKKEELNELNNQIIDFDTSSYFGKLSTMTLDPKTTYKSLGNYQITFNPSMWKETAGSALVGGLVLLGVYEFLIKRPIKNMFSKNKPKKTSK